MQRGGEIEEVDGMKQLLQLVSSANISHSPTIQSQASMTRQVSDEEEKEIVRLDVGGHRFTILLEKLMFSGRHQNCTFRMKDGTYVVDCDGSQFQHILNFLRAGAVVSFPREKADQVALAGEADYYVRA